MASLFGSGAAYGMSFGGAAAGGGLFGGSSTITGGIAQAFLGGGSGGGFAAATGGGSLFDPTTWIGAGQYLWNGIETGFSSSTSFIGNLFNGSAFAGYAPEIANSPLLYGGTTDALGFVPNYGAGGSFATGAAGIPGYGGYGSALGQGLGIAGGAIAGYNEYNAAGGGVAGLAGGAAYGIGTYFAGAAVSSAMAGGVAAGMAAIPVVGWIALAAMAINVISGGKLFGTAASPTGGDLTETIGASGATLTNVLHEKGQKALFGGAYYKNVNEPVDPQAQAAADAFFAALQKSTTDFATSFGTTMTTIVGGSFDQKYDKNGKPTTTSDTVLGATYTGETQAQFGERIQAENFIAVLDKLGVNATAYSQAFIGNADNLIKAIQDLGAATQEAYGDINRGMGLLGPDGNLGAVMSEVEKLAASGEALATAYTRLVSEFNALKSAGDYAQLSMGKSATQMLEFADAMATAAGGAQALQQLITAFNTNFYSPAQLQAQSVAQMQQQVGAEGAAIGQSSTESPAAFFAAFQSAQANLSAADLVKWEQFGNDLVALSQAESSAAQNYAQFMAQFGETGATVSAFEQTMRTLSSSIVANIKNADDLAKANGLAGASAQDIGAIIVSSVTQGLAALNQLETEAQGLATSLFGVAANSTQFEKQQQAQQQFLQASQLLGDLAQIGAVNGDSLGKLAQMFGIPLDKLAGMLGTNMQGLVGQFGTQEKMALAAIQTSDNTKLTNEILADILAASQGQKLPYSEADLGNALYGTNSGALAPGAGKGGAAGATGGPIANGNAAGATGPNGTPHDPVTVQTPTTTTAINNQTTQVVNLLRDIRDRTIARDRYYSPRRNTRPVFV